MTERNRRKVLNGVILSDKMEKTAVVLVEKKFKHKKYQKLVKRRKKYYVHDENKHAIGEKVTIMETRPLSKTKRWRIVDKLKTTNGSFETE